jgi:DNA-binding CsgD family transcriptional regulator
MTIHQEVTLHKWMAASPLTIQEFLDTAVMLAEMVYHIHKQNETIGALNPHHIKIRPWLKQAVVTDTTKWSSAYRSPDYTGTMNRVPDALSDLYSLGVIFYELLTGQLPIQPRNAEADWALAHVVELPQPLTMYRSELEGPLQAIVMKLLAKSPGARYQTAYGLLVDLKLCASNLEQHGLLPPIDIGRIDERSRFEQPSNPIGREYVLHELETAYVQAAQGFSIQVNLCGEEGTGKHFLITHFVSTLIRRGVQVMTAVCSDDNQRYPFASILQAIRHGLEQLWGEDSETIAKVKDCLVRELGQDAAHIHMLLPEAAALLGLPSNETISPSLHEPQIKEALLAVLRSFTTYIKPLVLWLDDMDQADSGTMDVINSLVERQFESGIMLIGVQRTEMELNSSEDASLLTNRIKLESFVYEDVRQWVMKTVHEDSMRVRVFARWVFDLTTGNPSAIRKLLQQWITQKKLIFDELQQRWTWDQLMSEMQHDSLNPTKRVYEEELQRLDERTKELLIIASVCGMRFNSSIVSEASGHSHVVTLSSLAFAEREGIIYCDDAEVDVVGDEQGRDYLFMFTQLQSMLYKHLEGSHEQWHYKIGWIYKNRLSATSIEDVRRVAYHWNRIQSQLSMDEQRALAQYNTRLCVLMNKRRKYLDAKAYADTAIYLMEQVGEPISNRYRCYTELAYSDYMLGNLEQMRAHFQYLMQHADELGRIERVNLAVNQIEMFTFENNAEAIRNGQIALAQYGWLLPKRASVLMLLSEVVRTQLALRKSGDELSTLPLNTDADYELLNRLLLILGVPMLTERPIEQIVLSARFIRYGLGQGMNEYLLCNIGLYELILQRGAPWLYRLIPTGTLQKLQSSSVAHEVHQYRLPLIFAMSIQLEQPRETTDYLMKSLHRSLEYGDVTMVNLSIIAILITYYGNVHGLMELISSIELEAQHMIDEKTLGVLKLTKGYGEALRDERAQIQYIKSARHTGQLEEDNYMCICKLEVAYYAGQYREALDWARRGKRIELKFDWLQNRKLRLFEALSGAALYPTATTGEQRDIVRLLRKLKRQMKKWSGYWGYQSSAYRLILAEWKRITGKGQDVVSAYEAAFEKAKEEQYVLMEAIAGERLYDYYVQSGSKFGAVVSLMDGCAAYSNWGLQAKVNAIKLQNPDIKWYSSSSQELSQLDSVYSSEVGTGTLSSKAILDVQPGTEVDILSRIAQWTDLGSDDLLKQFLDTAIRQLGADRGCILTYREDQFRIQVHAGRQVDEIAFPVYLCRYVRMSGKPVLLEDASKSHYVKDSYIARLSPASVICMRIGKPYKGADWLLYIENSQVTGVFTEQSLHVLELMITRLSYLYWIQHDHTMEPASRPSPVQTSFRLEPSDKLTQALTQRETEVLHALVAGLSNKEIAECLGISVATVKTHIINIYSKLGVKRRGQAIARAKELNMN